MAESSARLDATGIADMSGPNQDRPLNICEAFLNGEAIPGVFYMHNDYVRVISGSSAGSSGSLVSLVEVEPEPLYILELETGFDIKVRQSEIGLVEV
jgi:hypothetical protein